MTREQAYQLMCEWTASDSLRKHMLAVEAAMRFYARKFNEDEQTWAVVGLLHDMDYERHPSKEEHPYQTVKLLRERGEPEAICRAILAHADYTGVQPETLMEKTILAVDELCGFLTAVALVRPNKSLREVEVSSVKKKLKDKAFARQVSREDILRGATLLNLSLDEHIANCLEAMKSVAAELGLQGEAKATVSPVTPG
ncbi:MAG: HD domain-containing protein [candidate division KSB1 bacterium]|nr:HD domain-containing protein [candidate division KSB1 bacterium]MDZ7274848.1 HD domain-containing protein [candidate division KSB1 bacterium]MDZ7288215.1 HD domain-containing protein [candidate division KSB1 bacterium]MDZ7300404.1 HD domain-containing protein [candidate division KSB1 bacterium]MDZ7308779.1 HD domain-containing protein [candidate division KSB1 bacterium]